ncbi:ribose 1,5-bisphosphokinase [Agarivorans sp. 1_MG-2023]|uniref:ribose 1,5-bisphosphokinase n=1 Tax=Agarivorans sp. 1_MG-2023 TaxID=3062634 RepID=UPI0026E3B18B|nr:ribose 1,5-bisphosphokinase [Agarivorans sp. 1_MG-2023]MDO6765130.1 ribose 1,5-bisphosphokinase [Agarivorans sp. 1_MG-2023]
MITLSQPTELSGEAKLFYLVGPSGSGKDSIINLLRSQLQTNSNLLIAHRYITRAVDDSGENHIALSVPEFTHRKHSGLFAMDWQANGCNYAVGNEVNTWLSMGFSVLFNGSRQHIDLAEELFGERLRVIALDVEPEILAQRLQKRGREQQRDIEARLRRSAKFQANLPEQCWRLDNNRSIENTVNKLLKYIDNQTTELYIQ